MVADVGDGDVHDIVKKMVAECSPSKRATMVQIRKLTAAIAIELARDVDDDDVERSSPIEIRRRSNTPRESTLAANIALNGCLPTSSRASKMLAIARSHSPASSTNQRPSPAADATPVGILVGHGTNPIREERKMKQRRHDRRKRRQLAHERATALPIDVEEVELPQEMRSMYGRLLVNTNDPVDIFHVLLKTLETCYAKHTWQESVGERTLEFTRSHLRQSISTLKSSQYARNASLDETMRELEVQTLLHLHALAVYEAQFAAVSQDATRALVDVLCALQLNAASPSRMQDFLLNACMDEFEHVAWRHLGELFDEMGFELPFDLQYRRDRERNGGGDRSSSPMKSCRSEASLTWADLDSSKCVVDVARKRARPANDARRLAPKTPPKLPTERRRKRRVLKTRTVSAITPVKEQMPLSEKRARKCRRLLTESQLNDSVDDTPVKGAAGCSTTSSKELKETRASLASLVSKMTRRKSRVREAADKLMTMTARSPQPPTPKRRRISDFLFTNVMYSSEKKSSPGGRLRSSAVKNEVESVKNSPVILRARKNLNLHQSPVKQSPIKSEPVRLSPRMKSPKSSSKSRRSLSVTTESSPYRRLPRLVPTAIVCSSGPSTEVELGAYRIPTGVVDNYHHSVRALKVRRKDGEYPVFYGRDAVRLNVFATSAEQVGRLVMSTRSNGTDATSSNPAERPKASTSSAAVTKPNPHKHSQAKNRTGKKVRAKPTVAMSACAAPLLNVQNARPHQPTLVKHMAAKLRTPVKVQRCTRVFSKAKHSQMQRRVRALHDRVRAAKSKTSVDDDTLVEMQPSPPLTGGRRWESASDTSEPSTSTMSAAVEHDGTRHSVGGSPTANRC